MATIPLEDNFTDIIGKAQRGLKLSDDELARRAGVTVDDLGRTQSGKVDEAIIRKLASTLNLGPTALVESALRRTRRGYIYVNNRFEGNALETIAAMIGLLAARPSVYENH